MVAEPAKNDLCTSFSIWMDCPSCASPLLHLQSDLHRADRRCIRQPGGHCKRHARWGRPRRGRSARTVALARKPRRMFIFDSGRCWRRLLDPLVVWCGQELALRSMGVAATTSSCMCACHVVADRVQTCHAVPARATNRQAFSLSAKVNRSSKTQEHK